MRPTLIISLTALLLGARADPTEDQENALQDPTAECAPYSYTPVNNALSAFPPIGTPVAGIVPGDTAAQAKFDSFKANIPNIAPKGANGTADPNLKYDPTDPDCWWTYSTCTTPKLAGLKPDIYNVPEPRTLGYGFDDGPNCSHNAFYDYLTEQKQKATMFFIGTNVMYQPLQALRAALDGHEICVHTWSHHLMTAFNNEQVFAELWYTMQSIKLVTGYTPTCWRPAQGDVDDRVRYIAQQLNLQNVLWHYDAFDWKVASGQSTPAEVQGRYDDLVTAVGNGTFDTIGAIMLTHELDNYTMQTAMDNYPKLAAAFDHIVPVGVAFNKTQPYAETNFSLPNFAAYVAAAPAPPPSGGNSSTSTGGKSGSATKSDGNTTNPQGGISAGVPLRLSHTGVLAFIFALLGAALSL